MRLQLLAAIRWIAGLQLQLIRQHTGIGAIGHPGSTGVMDIPIDDGDTLYLVHAARMFKRITSPAPGADRRRFRIPEFARPHAFDASNASPGRI
jgi:hypothetical protein